MRVSGWGLWFISAMVEYRNIGRYIYDHLSSVKLEGKGDLRASPERVKATYGPPLRG